MTRKVGAGLCVLFHFTQAGCERPEPPRYLEVRGMPPATTATAIALWVPREAADSITAHWCNWYYDTLAAGIAHFAAWKRTETKRLAGLLMDRCEENPYDCEYLTGVLMETVRSPEYKRRFYAQLNSYIIGLKPIVDTAIANSYARLDTTPGRFTAQGGYLFSERDSLGELVVLAVRETPVYAVVDVLQDTTLIPYDTIAFRRTSRACPDTTPAASQAF